MDELETLKAQLQITRRREDELREQLRSEQAQAAEIAGRLTLTNHEKKTLNGDDDGCIRVGVALPILRRVFGELAFT